MNKDIKRQEDYTAPEVRDIRVAVYRVLCDSVDGNPTGEGSDFNDPERE